MNATPAADTDSRPEAAPPVVLVAFDPRSYREAIGNAIRITKPHLEVRVVAPGELGREVALLAPMLVLSSLPNTFAAGPGTSWLEFRPYEKPTATICGGGRRLELEKVELDDLLRAVDRAQDIML